MGSFNYHSDINWNLVLDAEQLLISQVIERRNIRWLCHFTPRSNLENIKQNGLKTRDLLSNWETTVTDQARFDQHRNAICLSISKPNSWMFNKKCEQGFDLCLLLISPEILYKKNCLFFPHNAATASYRNINIESLKDEQALENLFANPISFQKSGKPPQDIFRFHYLLDCETTSDQAEVQCLENIETQYITHIFEYDIPLTYDEIKARVDESSYDIGFDELFIKEPHNKIKEEASLSNDFDLMQLKSLRESVKTLLESTGTVKLGESVTPIIQNKDVEEDKASNTGFRIKEFGELPGLPIEKNKTSSKKSTIKRRSVNKTVVRPNLSNDFDLMRLNSLIESLPGLPIEKNKTSSKTSTISRSFKSEVNKTVVRPNHDIKPENKHNIKSSSVRSGGGASGDGCLGFIILAILIIIFVL